MKGLCKTDCGCDVEYIPHEFSDGFVYYLPRNLDGTVHNCIFSEEEPDFFDIEPDAIEEAPVVVLVFGLDRHGRLVAVGVILR